MSRPHAITDHTTAIRRKSWAARADGRPNADPMVEIGSMTSTEKRILTAFKQALSDGQTHKMDDIMRLSDIKSLIAELKLPHTKIRYVLKNVPNQILYYVNPKSGHTYIALKPAATENGTNRQDDTRQLSASVPASGSRGNGSSTAPATSTSRNATALFADDTSTDDTDSDGQGLQAGPSRLPTVEKSAQAGSTWAMQPPKEQQAHHKEVANASTSPQKRDRFTYFGPRRSEPTRSVSTASQQPQQASEKADELGNRRAAVGAGAESDNDEEEDLLSAIRESLGAPSQQNVTLPPEVPVRKQPASPSAAAIRETVAEYGLDEPVNEDLDMSNMDSNGFFNEGGNATFTPSRFRDDAQDRFGEEIPFDQIQPQAGPSRRRPDEGEDDNEDSDFDMDAPVKSHQRTSSGGGSARKEVPDIMLDGYKATRSRGRSARPGPPGMDETSTRDSSVQDADSQEGGDLDDDADDKPAQDLQLKPTTARRGPTKPGTLHRQSSNQNDDSSDDDVVVVTSVRVGAPPAKSKEDREAEWQARQAKRKEREARRLEKEKSSLKRKRNPLPNFRNTQAEEAKELKAAYEIYLNDLNKKRSALEGSSRDQVIDIDAHQENESMPQAVNDLATVAEENASWTQVFSYESAKGRGTRPDYNTVKFWPYNLPFPGRLKDEAIIAVAGGCVVRVFRLSEKRGITELWNTLDESMTWEQDHLQEVFYSCAWTYDVRREAGIAPHWRKWPILCIAGKSKEVKVLDGYSGALLKVIQGHGGPIYSLAVHPTLPHVIATASADESISMWDISVPIAKPEVIAGYGMLEELDKRRKGYAEGERLCVFGGYAGHVEAVLSIDIHPSLPLLVSGGGDCKLRIWRIPDNLPRHPTSSLTRPDPIPPPEKSRRPPSFAFPIFTQPSLHSHHIDHVEWVGHAGHTLTRSLCYDAPGKRVIRLFRPRFFDTFDSDNPGMPMDIVGFGIDYPPQVDLVARWTTPSCSGGVGDGVICTASELVVDNKGKLTSRRRVYVPSIEPAVHVYDLDTKNRQPDVKELLQKYPFKLGQEILFEVDKRKTSPLRAADCQTAGRGWIVAVGEGEKITVWKRKDGRDRVAAKGGIEDLLRSLSLLEEREDTPLTAGHLDDLSDYQPPFINIYTVSRSPQAEWKQTNGVHSTTPPKEANVNTIEVQRQLGTAVEAALEEPAGLQVNAAINGHTTIDEEARNPMLPADDRMFLRSPSVEYVS